MDGWEVGKGKGSVEDMGGGRGERDGRRVVRPLVMTKW